MSTRKKAVINPFLVQALKEALDKKRRDTGNYTLSMRQWSLSLFDRDGYLSPLMTGRFEPDSEHLEMIARDLGEPPEKWLRLLHRTTRPPVISPQEEQLMSIFNSLSNDNLKMWLDIGQSIVDRSRDGR